MGWHYEYTLYMWPVLASAGFIAMLATYGWRHRSVPAALPLAVMWWLAVPWASADALVLAAVDVPAKIFWAQFQTVWMLPMATAGLCFALEYANLGSWLNRRTLALLAFPSLLFLLLALTNKAHHLLWLGFSLERYVVPRDGIAGRILFGYGVALLITTSLIFIWLFVRSPLHRRPVALCLGGQLAMRIAVPLGHSGLNPIAPVDPAVIACAFTAGMYALAVFRFRMLDLVPIARGTVIQQMREGMLVLDSQQRLVDLNPAAERILGMPAARARGTGLTEMFPACGFTESEITLGTGGATRHYALHHSTLKDRRGLPLGYVILLHDISEQKRVQAEVAEQRSALATLRERDRVARELHDSLGQVLGYVKMQAQLARGLLTRGEASEADAYLAQLAAAAQEAYADVREYILGARAGMSTGAGFLPALENYLQRLRQNYGLATKLSVSPELAGRALEPMAGTQLLRIIQEALTNVRKHARARNVDIRIGVRDSRAEAVVQDDGAGFDIALLETAEGQKFGLRFMRERAQEVGGDVQVHSAPGEGTRVVACVPLGKALA